MYTFRLILGFPILLGINAAPQGFGNLFPGQQISSSDYVSNLDEITRINQLSKALELKPPQEVSSVHGVDYMGEVYKKQLVKALQEVLNKEELTSKVDVDAKEVSAQEVDVTPVKNVQEVQRIDEIIDMVPVPDAIANKFLAERNQNRMLKDDYLTEGLSSSANPNFNVQEVRNKIEVMDKQLVNTIEEIKELEELISQLEVTKLDEVIKLEEIRNKEEVKSMEEIMRLEDVNRMQEVNRMEEVNRIEEVKSKQPITKIEEVESMVELTPAEVDKLKQMINSLK